MEQSCNGDVVAGKKYGGPSHRQLANPAGDKATADHDAFGILQSSRRRKRRTTVASSWANSSDDSVHQACCDRIVTGERFIQLRLRNFFQGSVAEGITVGIAQTVAPFCQNGAKRTPAGAVAYESVLIPQLRA